MNRTKKIAPSIIAANYLKLGDEIINVINAGADILHLDIMDGHFVPNITIGADLAKAVRSISTIPIEVHLMVNEPEKFINYFTKSNPDIITIHYEATKNLKKLFELIKKSGAKVGISIKPTTKVEVIEKFLSNIDYLLIMSVEPGFYGQKFIPESLSKIKAAYDLRDKLKLSFKIAVDGGVCADNISDISKAGADVFISGAEIFKKEDRKAIISKLKTLATSQL